MKGKHKDFLGKKLRIGDNVVFMQVGYRNLMQGVVQHFSPKTVTILHKDKIGNDATTRQFKDQVVKV